MQNEINVQNLANNIKHIVEKALGQKISVQPNAKDLLHVAGVDDPDQLQAIKYYLQNPHLITAQLIADVVGKQLSKYVLPIEEILPPATTWGEYLNKLEKILEQVKYRKANNYEYQVVMPSKRQLFALQKECWELTQQWYGEKNGNLSCFYAYFVAMSQAAGVTCFSYDEIGKFISPDNFLSLINREQRLKWHKSHDQRYADFIKQGGCQPQGRSVIDATSLSNFFYYKNAQLLFNLQFVKNLVLQHTGLENYGQLPYAQRLAIWQLLQQDYAINHPQDTENIYYKYVEFLNARPGEYYNHFANDLPEANHVEPRLLHDIVKLAGLQTGNLIMLSRDVVDNWIVKRHFNLTWERRYPLVQINSADNITTVRQSGAQEVARFLPNELPYTPGHGLSLCGNGLPDDLADCDRIVYEWNTPIDATANFDNWPRDFEKLFREFRFFYSYVKPEQNRLFGDKLINMFHNPLAYSTIHTTEHTHLVATPLEQFPLYTLPATESYILRDLQTTLEFVSVGSDPDALFIRFMFANIENEPLLQFLIALNTALFKQLGGMKNFDVHLHLFATLDDKFAFIYEPHAFLIQLEKDTFLNPHNNKITPRKPQLLQPEGQDIQYVQDMMAEGLPYWRRFFDDNCQPGIYNCIRSFIQDFVLHP